MNNVKHHRTVFQHLSRDEMFRYKVNRLNASEKLTIEKHLADCSLCNEALNGLNKMDELGMYKMMKELKRPSMKRKPLQLFSANEKLIVFLSLLLSMLLIAIAAYFLLSRSH